MLFSSILEDEFSSGYLGRLRVINQCTSNQELICCLNKNFHPLIRTGFDLPLASTLSLAAGIPLKQFIEKHSLLPFYRIVVCNDVELIDGHMSSLNMIRRFGVDVRRNPLAKFCLSCVSEDNESRGYAYWRRSHQTPGIHWCNKHNCQLALSTLALKAFENPPSTKIDSYYQFSAHEFSEMMENFIIHRYIKIANAFLNLNRPISLHQANYRIGTLINSQHKIEKGYDLSLSEEILEFIPYSWIKPLYLELTDRGGGIYFNSIDNLTLRLVNPMSYIIILAYFFDSLEDSLKYWFDENEDISAEN